ncbi:MAG: type II secretion system protein GspG [Candidatus Scalindua sp.]|nr:type II secretion system protein GspG [Candidatus Scalindua sp.]
MSMRGNSHSKILSVITAIYKKKVMKSDFRTGSLAGLTDFVPSEKNSAGNFRRYSIHFSDRMPSEILMDSQGSEQPAVPPSPLLKKNSSTGFTLVEMLVVLVIIMVLVGITVPVVSSIQTNAKSGVTAAQISQLGLALRQFESDFGFFPPDSYTTADTMISLASIEIPRDDDLNTDTKCLVFFLGSRFKFNSTSFNEIFGPYIEFKRSQIEGSGADFASDTATLSIEGVNGTREVFQYKDPFGSDYSYVSSSPSHNIASFDIYSFGPDKVDDSGNSASDDITNW